MDQKNFIVAIVLSVLIIVGWQAAFPPAKPPVTTTQQTSTQPGASGEARTAMMPSKNQSATNGPLGLSGVWGYVFGNFPEPR